MALFKKDSDTAIGKTLASLKANFATQAPVNKDISRSYALEGYEKSTSAVKGDLIAAETNLRNTLQQTLMAAGFSMENFHEANVDSAVASAMLSLAVEDFTKAKIHTDSDLSVLQGQNVVHIPSSVPSLEKRSASMEAFDQRANANAAAWSVVYNAFASRQDELGETWFPTVVQTPDQVGFVVSVQLIEVINDVRRGISGDTQSWGRKNVVKALKDSTILDNTSTKIVPVHRAESAGYFNTDIGTKVVKVGNEDVTTGALLPGKTFDLLALSQTAAAVAAGLNDTTDAIDSAVRLRSVYIKLAGSNDIIEFQTANIPTFTFNNSIQNNARMLQLAAATKTLQVKGTTLQVDGSPLDAAATIGTNSVRLGVQLFGTINQQEGTTFVQAGNVTVEGVFDNTGTELGTSAGAGATIKALFNNATIVAYNLDAHRTNSNRRQRGQLIDTRDMNYLYAVPVLPPISALRPVGSDDSNDQKIINSLITTTRIRTANSAVTALVDAASQLKAAVSVANSGTDIVEIFGAAREVITPTYVEASINVLTSVDSLTSSDRAEDVSALLINKIRDVAWRLHRDSNYKAADDALNGGEASKPVVLIATDAVIGRYLTLTGDTRLAGDYFDFKVTTSIDNRMKGKIFISLGKKEAFTSGSPNPLHFGCMAWKPELTLALPNTRNGAQVMEITVQPMYLHVPNLPVLGVLEVTGIEDVIASKVAINNHPV